MYLRQNNNNQATFFEPKTEEEISIIKQGAEIVCNLIQKAKQSIELNISTQDIEDIVKTEIKKYNCKSAFFGYRGYPATTCISIDTELVHGIPSKSKKILPGQIVSIDIGIFFEGYCADAATTVLITNKENANISNKLKIDKLWNLLEVTYNSMIVASKILKENIRVGDLSFEIQNYVETRGYSVIREYVGHTIGRQMHEKPDIPNFGKKCEGPRFYDGQVICIEPMVSMGNYKTKVLSDGWTVVMEDNSYCAHFEHMILIKKDSYEILTKEEIIKPEKIYV
ncbi:MAG: type I methionyl aminopeptidase [Endomicrobiia bacterium]